MATHTMTHPATGQAADFALRMRARWREVRGQFARPELGFDWLRVYLGIGLVVRGVLFAREPALIEQFLGNTAWFIPMLMAHGLVMAHIVGGIMLSLGLCTRWAAGVQVPFLAGAVFLVHWHEGLLARSQSLEFSALVLVMLLVYLFCGAGDFSLDQYLRRVPPEVATAEPALSMQRSLLEPYHPTVPTTPSSIEDLKRDDLQVELTGANLDVPVDPPYAREQFRGVKWELALLLGAISVLLALLAGGWYVAAAAWTIGALVMFTIWIIGQAQLE